MARPVEDFVVDSGLELVPTYGGGGAVVRERVRIQNPTGPR